METLLLFFKLLIQKDDLYSNSWVSPRDYSVFNLNYWPRFNEITLKVSLIPWKWGQYLAVALMHPEALRSPDLLRSNSSWVLCKQSESLEGTSLILNPSLLFGLLKPCETMIIWSLARSFLAFPKLCFSFPLVTFNLFLTLSVLQSFVFFKSVQHFGHLQLFETWHTKPFGLNGILTLTR